MARQNIRKRVREVPYVLIVLAAVALIAFSVPVLMRRPARAATTQITGGTNGPDCGSGGYFTPSSVTITSDNTVTISVPSNDPYAGGIQVHGFPEGNFTVLANASHTTTALSSNVSYYGTWPNTGCMKGSGTITVTAASPSPSPSRSPSPSPSSSPSPTHKNHTSTSTSTNTPTASSRTTAQTSKSSTTKKATTSKTAPATTTPTTTATQSGAAAQPLAVTTAKPKSAGASTAYKAVGTSSALLAIAGGGWLLWRFGPGRSLLGRLLQLTHKEH